MKIIKSKLKIMIRLSYERKFSVTYIYYTLYHYKFIL